MEENRTDDTQKVKRSFSAWLGELREFMKGRFSLDEDKAQRDEVVASVSKGVEFRGVNLWVLIFATMIAYFLNLKALQYITPFVESVYYYLLPVTGAIVSISLGLQKFSWHDPIALVLIIAGFLLINKKTTPKIVTSKP